MGSPSLSQESPAGDEASKDSWLPSWVQALPSGWLFKFSALQRSMLILTHREKHAEQRDDAAITPKKQSQIQQHDQKDVPLNWRNCPNWPSSGAYHPYSMWRCFYIFLSKWDMHAPWQVGQRTFIVNRRRRHQHHLPHPLPLNFPAGSPAFRLLWRRSCLKVPWRGGRINRWQAIWGRIRKAWFLQMVQTCPNHTTSEWYL